MRRKLITKMINFNYDGNEFVTVGITVVINNNNYYLYNKIKLLKLQLINSYEHYLYVKKPLRTQCNLSMVEVMFINILLTMYFWTLCAY